MSTLQNDLVPVHKDLDEFLNGLDTLFTDILRITRLDTKVANIDYRIQGLISLYGFMICMCLGHYGLWVNNPMSSLLIINFLLLGLLFPALDRARAIDANSAENNHE